MGLTSQIGEFVAGARFDPLPPECIKTVCLGFTDCVAVMLPGWTEPVSRIAARAFGRGVNERSNRPLDGIEAPAPDRALLYAVAAHTQIDPIAERDADEPAHSPFDRVRFRLREGREIASEPVYRPRGHFTRPVNGERLWRKFSDCAGGVLGEAEAQTLFAALQRLPQASSVADLGLLPGLARR
jgi:2-methylcitrate dehydratase PrpD